MFVMRNVKGPTQLSWRTAFNFHQSFLHSGGAIATHVGGVLEYVVSITFIASLSIDHFY